ncbi:cucumber peeling cupredoxin-like [Chenopodium quinoa]|uniref:cucumber peeling cupredoxin-like n=1 Tax=Chenopodium quinoa TaxID=63459 RepID=UPI000B76EECB|nr:cucumber peeling cupredoxin-like [Chenopodium quinoa]
MAGAMSNVLFIVAVAIIMVSNGVVAETHIVGDKSGWTVPSPATLYSTWAAKQDFAIGDILDFQFSAPHNVAEVSKEGYEACDPGNAEVFAIGPKEITLNTTGPHYFVCTFASHCVGGQKLVVTVGSTSDSSDASPGPTTTASPSPAPSVAPPPPSDVGSSPPLSITSTFFSVSFIASIMAILF